MSLLDLLPLLGIVVIMWLLMVRPAQKRQREQARMVAALAPGDHVMTTSGMLGVVREVGDQIALEVAPGVVLRLIPPAIARVMPQPTDMVPPIAAPDGSGADQTVTLPPEVAPADEVVLPDALPEPGSPKL